MYVLYILLLTVTDGDRYTDGYSDTLQIPLQPLMDNLEVSSITTILYVCMFVWLLICMHVWLLICMYVCLVAYMYVLVCMCICIFGCLYVFMYICMLYCHQS